MSTIASAKPKSPYSKIIIAMVLSALIKLFLPPVNGLTESGINLLAIFIFVVFLWVTVSIGWPSALGLVLIVITNTYPAIPAFAMSYGSVVVAYIIPAFVMSAILAETGVMRKIAEWFITRRVVIGRPYVFMLLFATASFVVGTLISTIMAGMLFVLLARSIAESIGYTEEDKFFKSMCFFALWYGMIPEGMMPFGKAVPLSAITTMASLGYTITLTDFLFLGIPFFIGSIIWGVAIIRFVYRPDTSKFINYDVDAIIARMKANPLSLRAKIVMIFYIVTIIGWLMPNLMFIPVLPQHFRMWTLVLPSTACLAILCLIRINGEPVVELEKELSKQPWCVLLFLGVIQLFSALLSNPDFGIMIFMQDILEPFANSMPNAVIIAVALTLCIIMTNCMSNMVAVVLSISIFIPALATAGASETLLLATGIAINMVGNVAFLTPAAQPGAPLVLNNAISVREALIPSLCLVILMLLTVMLIVVPMNLFIR
jgi:sodium-dependent dicarboxylate transporter 2/3/5